MSGNKQMCACGHAVTAHFAEPYCPACAGEPCDLDFVADWLAEHDRKVADAALAPVEAALLQGGQTAAIRCRAALAAIAQGRDAAKGDAS